MKFVILVLIQIFSMLFASRISTRGSNKFTDSLKKMCKGKETGKLSRNTTPQVPNGCGPTFLDAIGIGRITKFLLGKDMTECCNGHDICYKTCVANGTAENFKSEKTICDANMKKCLEVVAAKGSFRAKLTKGSLFAAVDKFGDGSFAADQIKHCKCD